MDEGASVQLLEILPVDDLDVSLRSQSQEKRFHGIQAPADPGGFAIVRQGSTLMVEEVFVVVPLSIWLGT
jgi:hypothetical protein